MEWDMGLIELNLTWSNNIHKVPHLFTKRRETPLVLETMCLP